VSRDALECVSTVFFLWIFVGTSFLNAHPDPNFYKDYAKVLNGYVYSDGMVDYQGLQQHRKPLDRFINSIADIKKDDYHRWNKNAQMVFLINVYNALTLQVILDHYPIQSSFLKGLLYPKNSIRQIAGVWDELMFTVMEEEVTLNHIEHEVLRPLFNEPRIHMALVCASISCPPLRSKPYTAEGLEKQLAAQSRVFLLNPDNFRVDDAQETVFLSEIFEWFGEDFITKYGQLDDKAEGGHL